ncbi:MAG: T9SS type A sorting domain-containing protein [Bacteroidetes bacterium]|nr:T9SS type A sorting domain-containing protein [Bacteroidota bacterium]
MYKGYTLSLFCSILFFSAIAQVELGPGIGIGTLPENADPICDIPLYLDDFDISGYQAGELIPEFNLFDLDGNEIIMSELLDNGKPVLMVAGSYTCPVFRNRVPLINQLALDYPDELEIIIIYGVEAHPHIDISPYFGYVSTTNQNINAGILYQQPTTYGERKSIVSDMLNDMDIQVPVYLDGPCNEWWSHYGPAPNNAYLIDTDGIILAKHPWLDKHPDDIHCDLEALLDLPADCNAVGGGDFSFEITSDPFSYGTAGNTLYVTGLLSNNSDSGVEIEIAKIEQELPADWATSICTDICYPSTVDHTFVWLEAGEELIYTHYFYTGETPATGNVQMGFRNTEDASNFFTQWMSATSSEASSTKDINSNDLIQVYPNPVVAGSEITFAERPIKNIEIWNASGQLVKSFSPSGNGETTFEAPSVPGIYLYRCHLSNGSTQSGRILVHQ